MEPGKQSLRRTLDARNIHKGMAISQQKIHFVTGKGGVGKSAFAAALALKLSQSGEKTLLVELGDRGFYSYVWKLPVQFAPQNVSKNLDICRWDGPSSLREYFLHLLKVKALVNLIFENKIMKSLVRASPALNELSILGKATSGLRRIGPDLNYQNIVIDGYATGHFKALFNAPRGIGKAIAKGPMGEQSRQIEKVISDSRFSKIYIVSLPEELPVNESLELKSYLEKEFSQQTYFVLNKVLRPHVTKEEMVKIRNESSKWKNSSMIHYLQKINSQQALYTKTLGEVGEGFLSLPHFFEPTSLALYQQMADEIKGAQLD